MRCQWAALLVLALVAVWTAAADEKKSPNQDTAIVTDDDATNKLVSMPGDVIEWIRANGGVFNSKQEFRRQDPDDPSSIYGVFAAEDIAEGEVLTSIPWKCLIWSNDQSFNRPMKCQTIKVLMEEIKKGSKSFFAPYTKYLVDQPMEHLPSTFSEEGQDVMDIISGNGMLPPDGMLTWMDMDWKLDCKGSTNKDSMEYKAAVHMLSRGDDGILIPLFDLYNHRNGDYYNVEDAMEHGVHLDLVAARDIKKGEQLFNSFNQCDDCEGRIDHYGTPEILRDYGFVEEMPQRWIFLDDGLSFDVDYDDDDNSTLEVYWTRENGPMKRGKRFLRTQVQRLQEVVGPELERIFGDSNHSMPTHEVKLIQQYYDALLTALTAALKEIGLDDKDLVDSACSKDENGVCAMDDDVYELNDMGEGEEDGQTCDNEQVLKFDDYDRIEAPSQYQVVTFMYRDKEQDKKEDLCLDLDDIVQICTSYRPQYHEFGTILPLRVKDSLKRAVFVGGGDSMILHELLKYPEIEKVVGLELDQAIVRQSFKYFHTQPHFDDPRVEWWFGDATKSLLVLPKEYFGSFDLVVVDLSETVVALTVTADLNMFEALALLLKPDGIFVKNEWYMDKMSEIFDYTEQIYVTNNPIICEQAFVFGSNRIDWLRPNLETVMNDQGVEMLIVKPVKDAKDRFMYVHDYRKNDALSEGKCDDKVPETKGVPNAGILMIVEAENTTALLEWETLEGALSSALQKAGLTGASNISSPSDVGGTVGVLIFNEGLVAVRTWPAKNYAAFDIHLWGAFTKMDDLRTAITTVVGSSPGSWSSYRIVVGGMLGTKTRQHDQASIGPVISQNRNCDAKKVHAKKGATIDESTNVAIMEESLKLLDDQHDLVVAVLCGDQKQECKTLEILNNIESVKEVIPIYTCPNIESAPYLENAVVQLFTCELETYRALLASVKDKKKLISALILDDNAKKNMAAVVERVLRNRRNQLRLIMPQVLYLSTLKDKTTDTWRENFLGRVRRYTEQPHVHRAEVVLQASPSKMMEVGITMSANEYFFDGLVKIVQQIEDRTGLDLDVREVQGGYIKYQYDYDQDWFEVDDYNVEAGKQQYLEQKPLGEQVILQLEISMAGQTKIPLTLMSRGLENALGRALKASGVSAKKFHVLEELGDGQVLIAVASEGSAFVIWDGDKRVDLNLFLFDPDDSIGVFLERFEKSLERDKLNPKVLLRDDQPRGIGRVVNFQRDIDHPGFEPVQVVVGEHVSAPDGPGRVVSLDSSYID